MSALGGARRRGVHAGVSAVAILVISGCTDSSDSTQRTDGAAKVAQGSPATPTASFTSMAAETARQRATRTYLAMWQDMAHAAKTSDWRSPLLARHATEDALGAITRGLYVDHRNGLVTRGEPKNSPAVIQLSPPANPGVVVIADCGDSSGWLKYRQKTGQLADDRPGGRQQITAEVTKQGDGAWKVTRFAVEGVGSC